MTMTRGMRLMRAEPQSESAPPTATVPWKVYVVGKVNHLQIGAKAVFPYGRKFFEISLSLKLCQVAAIPEPKSSVCQKLLKSKILKRIIQKCGLGKSKRRCVNIIHCGGRSAPAPSRLEIVAGLWWDWILSKHGKVVENLIGINRVLGRNRRMLAAVLMVAVFNFWILPALLPVLFLGVEMLC